MKLISRPLDCYRRRNAEVFIHSLKGTVIFPSIPTQRDNVPATQLSLNNQKSDNI